MLLCSLYCDFMITSMKAEVPIKDTTAEVKQNNCNYGKRPRAESAVSRLRKFFHTFFTFIVLVFGVGLFFFGLLALQVLWYLLPKCYFYCILS